MTKTITYQPEHVCSKKITVTLEDDIVQSVVFEGGCPGNTLGVSALCKGRHVDEVIDLLKGIPCRGSGQYKTSCPDQLSIALEKAKRA